MARRTLSLLAVVALLVGLVPLIASSATSGNVVTVAVDGPDVVAFAPVNPAQEPHHPQGRGTCSGWEVLNNYFIHANPVTASLTIRITGPDGTPQHIAALAPEAVFSLVDASAATSSEFEWGSNAGPGGEPPAGSLVPFILNRDLSECHGLGGGYDAYEALFSSRTLASGSLVAADPADACTALTNAGAVDGNVALVQTGSCDASDSYSNVLSAGATGVVFYNPSGSPVFLGGSPNLGTIPAVMVSQTTGTAFAGALAGDYTVNLTIGNTPTSTVNGPTWDGSLTASDVTQTSLTLNWPAADPGEGAVTGYRVYQDATLLDTVGAVTLSLNVSGLTAGTQYTFSVVADDDLGLESPPLTANLSTASAPYWLGGAQLTSTGATSDSVSLSWPAAQDDDGTVVSYRVSVNGVQVHELAGTGHTVGGLNPATSYTFSVVAVDNSELLSPPLAAAFSTTGGLVPSTVGAVDPSTGQWHLRNLAGNVTTFYFGVPGDIPMMGDWNCDGIDTPGLYRQSTGFAYIKNTNSQGVADSTFFFGLPGDIPLAGDFDGDGCDTIGVYRPSAGRVFISNVLPPNGGALSAQTSYFFGLPGDKPFVGDFDGDGVDTIGLHRESTGLVYFRNSHNQGIADSQFYFGIPNDRLAAGDWGIVDGMDTPVVFRPGLRRWYFRFTNSQGFAEHEFVWGESHWIPISGRFGLD